MTEPSTSCSLLKGTENLPEAVFIYKMLKSRAKEIQTLENTLAQPTGTKLVFQRLPKHMRRRTMSHKVKRLPRRLREAHLNQMKKSGLPPKQKRPSRKFKRRPKNLLQDYIRRQRKHSWLETHIWHAKRFHMIERWGYRLPDRPCDKAFRACYRASAKHCLLQDISYVSCVELTGPEEILSEHLKLLTNQCTGLTVNARAFKNGNREGSAIFYHKDSYPFKATGEVKFMWKPEQKETPNRQLWLWIHAAFYSELVNCLVELFNLQKMESNNTGNPCYHGTNGVKMTELKHSLNRFRLTGPLSHSVVKKSLKFVSDENKSPWLTEYLQLPENKQVFNEQTSFWNALENISTSSQLSPYLIMNLIVNDPRYNLPSKRTKALLATSENEEMQDIPHSIKYGSIWSDNIRTEVSKNIMSTSELLSQRRNKLVADNIAPLDASAIPLMLVQQPGNRNSTNNLGFCSGWDIISPSNWGRPLWLSLIMWGGRAGGIRESHMLSFEQGQPDFLHPDTKAGETEENRVSNLYKEKFFNLPPNKRVNYTKMGIVSPFTFAWKTLIGEWNLQPKPIQEFYVLRDRKKIQSLQEILKNKNMDFQNVNDINFADNCLVPVALTLLKRGRMKKFSIICLPEECDFRNKNEPVEPLHKDENQVVRKDLRDAHQKLLKRLRKRRLRAKETGKELPSNDNLIEEQAAKMKSLWLPEPKTIRNSCARQILGFVTNGDFSYTIGQGKCIGYVAVGALPTLFNREQRNLVLVRDTSNRQYRLANIEIICT